MNHHDPWTMSSLMRTYVQYLWILLQHWLCIKCLRMPFRWFPLFLMLATKCYLNKRRLRHKTVSRNKHIHLLMPPVYNVHNTNKIELNFDKFICNWNWFTHCLPFATIICDSFMFFVLILYYCVQYCWFNSNTRDRYLCI